MKKTNKVKIIAEIGPNHNGNLKLAKKMLVQLSKTKVDIVKFQLGWRGKQNEINYLDYERL